MKLVVARLRSEFRPSDLARLKKYSPVYYETKETPFDSISELFTDEEVVLAVKPGHIDGGWKGITKDRLSQIKKLRALCLSTTAYGWVPHDYLKSKKIPLTYTPGKSTNAVAEFCTFMAIGLLKKLPLIIKNDWVENSNHLGAELKSKKVGIVGLGIIGLRVADLCHAHGAIVSFWNRSPKRTPYPQVDIEKLFKQSDIVIITVASNAQTKGLISRKLIDLMGIKSLIVSVVDSDVYAEKYILEKVAKNELGGYAFEGEEKMHDFEGNVLAMPEIAYYTRETLENESRLLTDSIISIAEGHPVNLAK